jgi:hypothetical protein
LFITSNSVSDFKKKVERKVAEELQPSTQKARAVDVAAIVENFAGDHEIGKVPAFEQRWSLEQIVLIWRLVGMALATGLSPTDQSETAGLRQGFLRDLEKKIGDCTEIRPRDPSNLVSLTIETSSLAWGSVFSTLISAFPSSDVPSARASGELLLKFTEQLGRELVNRGLFRSEELRQLLKEREQSRLNKKDQPPESGLPEVADEDIPI